MKILPLNLASNSTIYFERELFAKKTLADFLREIKKLCVIITDTELEKKYAAALQGYLLENDVPTLILSFSAGEIYKTRETKQHLEDQLLEWSCGRDTCLIALGGGVVTDLTGFIAATYCRGIDAVYLPTSLLAMVDASIGGKTGVNVPQGKNMIGSFYQPKAIFIDANFLSTLPTEEYINGLAEIVKHALIRDKTLFYALEKNISAINQRDSAILDDIIFQSTVIKKEVVEQDEKEKGMRQILNFGHTIAHAIEKLEHYRIRHGEAVAIGILVEAHMAMQLDALTKEQLAQIQKLLNNLGLPLKTPVFLHPEKIKEALLLDKKTTGKVARFVLLKGLGDIVVEDQDYTHCVPDVVLDKALQWARENFS